MVPSSMRIAQTTATPMATTKARMPSPGPAAAGGGGRAELYHSRLLLLNGKPFEHLFEPPALPPATRAAPLRSTGVTSRGAITEIQVEILVSIL